MSSNEADFKAQHEEVQLLLPWFVTEQLAAEQAGMVEDHLRRCAACRADAGWEERLRHAEPPLPAGLDAEQAFARLMPRLDAPARPAGAAPGFPARLRNWLFGNGWMPWALAGQGVLVAGLVLQLVTDQGNDSYRALGNPEHAQAGNVVVVFRTDARLGDVQRIMHASGARIVDGPTVTGAYMLAVPPARQAQTIAELKADAGVQLAEALTWRGQQ